MALLKKSQCSGEILAVLGNKRVLELLELAGRTAYQSQDKINSDSAEDFIRMIRNRGHGSVLEHSAMTVLFKDISRGFTHELVRHRLASYTQESTRYVSQDEFKVIIPPDKDADYEKTSLSLPNGREIKVSLQEWFDLNQQMYSQLLEKGWPTEDARQVLPIGITSQIVVTANLREWRHIFKLRTDPAAHWEIRTVMKKLLQDVKQRVPVLFEDL